MNPAPDLAQLAQKWRTPMLRFALLHLQPREDAEDAVQDALAALLTTQPELLSQTDPKHYLFGILRHKVMDRLRRKYRAEIGYTEAFADDIDNTLFDDRGHWVDGVAPPAWVAPDEKLASDQFFAVVDLCVLKLPAKPARFKKNHNRELLAESMPSHFCRALYFATRTCRGQPKFLRTIHVQKIKREHYFGATRQFSEMLRIIGC